MPAPQSASLLADVPPDSTADAAAVARVGFHIFGILFVEKFVLFGVELGAVDDVCCSDVVDDFCHDISEYGCDCCGFVAVPFAVL